jgi:hypothetical protein
MLMGIVALGTTAGVLIASQRATLANATAVLPLGVALGLIMVVLVWVTNVWAALPLLLALGGIGGYVVVPMNALLQHRGAALMSSGRSIAVQNLNEQLGILTFGAISSVLTASGMSILTVLAMLGVFVAICMALIYCKNRLNRKAQTTTLKQLINASGLEKR